MANNNIAIIEQNLKDILSSNSTPLVRQNLLLLSQNIDNYLFQLDSFYSTMEDVSPIVAQYQAIQASQPTVTYAIYKKLIYSESEIESLLKQGYVILERIREFFTNETTKYEIGLIKNNKLFEFQLTLEQVLERTTISFNTRAKIDNIFKLRFTGGKNSLLNTYEQAEQKVNTDVSDSSTVFSAIYDYVHTEGSHGNKINKGNAYEAYKRIVANRSNRIPPPITVDLIQQALSDVRKNTASSIKGGDYLNSQIKFYSSAPSLVTTSLIRTSLQDISNSLKMVSDSELDQNFKIALSNIFIKNQHQLADNIERQGVEQSKEFLDNLLKTLGLNVR